MSKVQFRPSIAHGVPRTDNPIKPGFIIDGSHFANAFCRNSTESRPSSTSPSLEPLQMGFICALISGKEREDG